MSYEFSIIGPGDLYGRGWTAPPDFRHEIEVSQGDSYKGLINLDMVIDGKVECYRYPEPSLWFKLADIAEIAGKVRQLRFDAALVRIEAQIDNLRSTEGTPSAQLRGINSERWIGKAGCRTALEVAKVAAARRHAYEKLRPNQFEYFSADGQSIGLVADRDTQMVIDTYVRALHGRGIEHLLTTAAGAATLTAQS